MRALMEWIRSISAIGLIRHRAGILATLVIAALVLSLSFAALSPH